MRPPGVTWRWRGAAWRSMAWRSMDAVSLLVAWSGVGGDSLTEEPQQMHMFIPTRQPSSSDRMSPVMVGSKVSEVFISLAMV